MFLNRETFPLSFYLERDRRKVSVCLNKETFPLSLSKYRILLDSSASILDSSANILESSASILGSSASMLDSSASMLDSSDSSLNLSAVPEQAPQQGLLRTLAALKPRTSHHQSKDENLPNPRTKTFRPWFQDESSLDSGASKDDSSLVSSLVWVFILGFVLGLGLRPWIRPWIHVKSSLDRP